MTDLSALTSRFAHIFWWFALLVMCTSCSGESDRDVTAGYDKQSLSCLECHAVTVDASHRLNCLECHLPVEGPENPENDHPILVSMPAHPDNADRICGQCHAEQAEMVHHNDHYLLTGHLETIRSAFSEEPNQLPQPEVAQLPVSARQNPETIPQLVDDLLSRRCLRCHVYYPGDSFSQVTHGTGCAACHLEFSGMKMTSHVFTAKPSDDRCLSCHYGNHVGFDYYGRYEHDLNEEYRTPYSGNSKESPPYGVEYHQLAVDVHQAAGMVCIDCHRQGGVMGSKNLPTCKGCHDYHASESRDILISKIDDRIEFKSSSTGTTYNVPQLLNEAHTRYGDRFSCQVCHAQWGFNDASIHLMRMDHEEFDNFYKLVVDGSSEVQEVLSSHIDEDGDLLEPFMSDKFSNESFPGIWFRGFIERRWERMEFIEDSEGTVRVARPILDIHLSWIDEYEEIRYDNIRPSKPFLQSYAPHTIGKAGMFFTTRIMPYLDQKPSPGSMGDQDAEQSIPDARAADGS